MNLASIAVLTNAVVDILVELSPVPGVGDTGVPVNSGEFSGAFRVSAELIVATAEPIPSVTNKVFAI